MNILIILAHPDQSSLNHAIAAEAAAAARENGHTVQVHDLYAEGFDPLLPVQEILRDAVLPDQLEQHCREITEADGIIIVHPNWWGQPPAILKGWVDRVIRPGVAYRFAEGDNGEGLPIGLLKARAALVFNTSNTPAERECEVFGDPLEGLWKNCIFDFCGVRNFCRRMFSIVVTSSEKQRLAWLAEVRAVVQNHFPVE